MDQLIKRIVLITLIFAFTTPCEGFSPFSNNLKEDQNYKYYVGRALFEDNEMQAIENATTDAYRQAIKENFGVLTSYQSDFYNNIDSNTLIIRNSEKTQNVLLKEFERINLKEIQRNKKTYIYLLFRYSKREIKKEQVRLKGGNTRSPQLFSSTGSLKPKYKTKILINSMPEGAEVYLNGQRWGVTPVNIQGIKPGQYKLFLDHKNYQSVDEKLFIQEDRTQRVHKVLKPGQTSFSIHTTPSKADLYIDNRLIGKSPLNEIKVRSNEPHTLTIKHPLTETVSRTIRGSKDSHETISIDLPVLKAYFSINSTPTGTEIFVDGESTGQFTQTPPKLIEVKAGQRRVTLKKDGFQEKEIDQEFEPQEQLHLGEIKLVELTQGREPDSEEYIGAAYSLSPEGPQKIWKYRVNLDYSTATNKYFDDAAFYSLGFDIESRFSSWLGFMIGASWDMGLDSDTEPKSGPNYILSGYGAKVGIPIYFSKSDTTFFLSLEAGYIQHTYKDEKGSNNAPDYRLSQTRYGISFGKTMISNIMDWHLTYYQYNLKNQEPIQSISGGLGFVF